MKLAINQCPQHPSFWSVSIDDDNGGTRLTPGKCCGRWRVVKEWAVTPKDIAEMVNELESYADAASRAADEARGR